jgi:hypothetical protein
LLEPNGHIPHSMTLEHEPGLLNSPRLILVAH